jgi:hypothetical protein
MKFVVILCLCGGALAAVGCADGRGLPTSPTATAAASDLAATARGNEGTSGAAVAASLPASPRSGDLHVTKECSEDTGLAGSFCTITSSNIKAIEVGTRVIYLQASGATSLDSDIVLDTPGPGNNKAFGHCRVDFATALGVCTFSGGTGKFTSFSGTARVSPFSAEDFVNWHWEGTYSFSPRD